MKALIFAAIAAASLSGCGIPYSDGARIGVVQKVSNRGFIWRTFEGELVQEGFRIKGNSTKQAGGNVWAFSVASAQVAAQIEKAAESGAPVKLTYEQRLLPAPWQSSTSYIVTRCDFVAAN